MASKQENITLRMPPQTQEKPGLESKMAPRPRYHAPTYRGADKLKGQVALVTGGDSGIGRAVCVLFAREGADVALVYLPSEQSDAAETARAIHAEGGKSLLLPGDVTQDEFCQSAVNLTVECFGKLNILVNNAAYQQTHDRLEDISNEEWELTFRTNIFGHIFIWQEQPSVT